MVVGAAAWVDAAGLMLGIEYVFYAGLGTVLALIPVWALWFGFHVWRRKITL